MYVVVNALWQLQEFIIQPGRLIKSYPFVLCMNWLSQTLRFTDVEQFIRIELELFVKSDKNLNCDNFARSYCDGRICANAVFAGKLFIRDEPSFSTRVHPLSTSVANVENTETKLCICGFAKLRQQTNKQRDYIATRGYKAWCKNTANIFRNMYVCVCVCFDVGKFNCNKAIREKEMLRRRARSWKILLIFSFRCFGTRRTRLDPYGK